MNELIKSLFDSKNEGVNTIVITQLIKAQQFDEAFEAMQNYPFLPFNVFKLHKEKEMRDITASIDQTIHPFYEILKTDNKAMIEKYLKINPFPLMNLDKFIFSFLCENILGKLCELNCLNAFKVLKEKDFLFFLEKKLSSVYPLLHSMIQDSAYTKAQDEILDIVEEYFPMINSIKKAKYSLKRDNPKYLNMIANKLLFQPINNGTTKTNQLIRDSLYMGKALIPNHDQSLNIYLSTLFLIEEDMMSYQKLMNHIGFEEAKKQCDANLEFIEQINHSNNTALLEKDKQIKIETMKILMEKFQLELTVSNTNQVAEKEVANKLKI